MEEVVWTPRERTVVSIDRGPYPSEHIDMGSAAVSQESSTARPCTEMRFRVPLHLFSAYGSICQQLLPLWSVLLDGE